MFDTLGIKAGGYPRSDRSKKSIFFSYYHLFSVILFKFFFMMLTKPNINESHHITHSKSNCIDLKTCSNWALCALHVSP